MKIHLKNPTEFLINPKYVEVSPKLQASIAKMGVISPICTVSGIVVDGHQRAKAAQIAGINQVPVIELEGNASLLFADLNQHRKLNSLEIICAFRNLQNDEDKKKFCSLTGISDSPQMLILLDYLVENFEQIDTSTIKSVPINILRELGHLSQVEQQIIPKFFALGGTVGEKRLIVNLLRQCQRRNNVPDKFIADNASEVIEELSLIAQPRRTQAVAKFETTLKNLVLPSGFQFKIDSNFDKPGIDISFHLTRKNINNIDAIAAAAAKIFEAVEEL